MTKKRKILSYNFDALVGYGGLTAAIEPGAVFRGRKEIQSRRAPPGGAERPQLRGAAGAKRRVNGRRAKCR